MWCPVPSHSGGAGAVEPSNTPFLFGISPVVIFDAISPLYELFNLAMFATQIVNGSCSLRV